MIYAYWDFTTIALCWSALIRATREWGGEWAQGSAFGLLDGGRGLLAALTGTVMVVVYAWFLPEEIEEASLKQRTQAFQKVILLLCSGRGPTIGSLAIVQDALLRWPASRSWLPSQRRLVPEDGFEPPTKGL